MTRRMRGATAIEYGLLAALIVLLAIVGMTYLGFELGCTLEDVACGLQGLVPDGPGWQACIDSYPICPE